jgi:hypothetical protein
VFAAVTGSRFSSAGYITLPEACRFEMRSLMLGQGIRHLRGRP